MKINIIEKPTQNPTFKDLKPGDCFQLINSGLDVYMKLEPGPFVAYHTETSVANTLSISEARPYHTQEDASVKLVDAEITIRC